MPKRELLINYAAGEECRIAILEDGKLEELYSERTASATYTYNWEGSQGDKQFTIRGRGTRVLVFEAGKFRIMHEHLSRFPRSQ